MTISLPPWVYNALNIVNLVISKIAPVVNAIVSFMLPFLLFLGNALRNFIVLGLGILPTNSYLVYIIAASVIGVLAIVLAFIFPGEKPEKK